MTAISMVSFPTLISLNLQQRPNQSTVMAFASVKPELLLWEFKLQREKKLLFMAGGTFALYSLLCRHARLSILPNQQEDERLSAYAVEGSEDTRQGSMLKSFFKKHPKFRNGLLIFILLGTCMVIGDGVLTPAISDIADYLSQLKILNDYLNKLGCSVQVKVLE